MTIASNVIIPRVLTCGRLKVEHLITKTRANKPGFEDVSN